MEALSFHFYNINVNVCLVLQGNPIDWVSTHRYHHQFCDSDRDPHSPIEGFWFSHISWLFDTNARVERVPLCYLSQKCKHSTYTQNGIDDLH